VYQESLLVLIVCRSRDFGSRTEILVHPEVVGDRRYGEPGGWCDELNDESNANTYKVWASRQRASTEPGGRSASSDGRVARGYLDMETMGWIEKEERKGIGGGLAVWQDGSFSNRGTN
jgi:hypothetical protein